LSWEAAVQQVLEASSGALRTGEIAEQVALRGLKKSIGANPAASIAAILSKSLGEENTPFQRVGPGQYTLRSQLNKASAADKLTPVAQEEATETGALRAFGMFWRRDQVVWRGKPALLGRQGVGATRVNFGTQIGVYLLHDRDRVIYVGRAMDTMAARLLAHTIDRLGGRWDRFSWFGLRNVGPTGELIDAALPWNQTVVVETFEALLIEALEPPLNRRRGDNFSGVEYLQVADPEIEKSHQRRVIDQLSRAISSD
jgi:hypothetical protein